MFSAGHTLQTMRKKMHMTAHQCVSPVAGMYHWNYMPADTLGDSTTKVIDPD